MNRKEVIENSVSVDMGRNEKNWRLFLLVETIKVVKNGRGETENRYYSKEHYQPSSFYIL